MTCVRLHRAFDAPLACVYILAKIHFARFEIQSILSIFIRKLGITSFDMYHFSPGGIDIPSLSNHP